MNKLSFVAGIGLEVVFQPAQTITKNGADVEVPEHRLLLMHFLGDDVKMYSAAVGESWAPGTGGEELAHVMRILDRFPVDAKSLQVYDPDPSKPQVVERGKILPYDGVWISPLVPTPLRPTCPVQKAKAKVVGWGVELDFGRRGDAWYMPYVLIRLPVSNEGKGTGFTWYTVKAYVHPPRSQNLLIKTQEFGVALPTIADMVTQLMATYPFGSSAGYEMKGKKRPWALLDAFEGGEGSRAVRREVGA